MRTGPQGRRSGRRSRRGLPTNQPEALSAEARRARREAAHRRLVRQRRITAVVLLMLVIAAVVLVVAGFGSENGGAANAGLAAVKNKPKPKPKPPPELPGGGRRLFPHHRIVAYYGAPQNVELGALGIGTPDQAGRKLLAQMRPYRRGGRHLLPAMELLALVAAGSAQPGRSDKHQQELAGLEEEPAAARP